MVITKWWEKNAEGESFAARHKTFKVHGATVAPNHVVAAVAGPLEVHKVTFGFFYWM